MRKDENEDKLEYKEKDIVWAKVKGYPWWPSIISNISFQNISSKGENLKENIYSIEFIGEKIKAKLPKEKIEPFNKNYEQHINTSNTLLLKSIELAKNSTEKKQNPKLILSKENFQEKNIKKDTNFQINQNIPTKKSHESSEEKSKEEKDNDKNIKYLQKKRLNEHVIFDDNDEEVNNKHNLETKVKDDKKKPSPTNNIKINININLTTNNRNMVNINSFHSSDVLNQNNTNPDYISNNNYSSLSANEKNNNNQRNNNNNLNDIANLNTENVMSSIEKYRDKKKEENQNDSNNEEKIEKNNSQRASIEERNESEEDNENDESIINNDIINEIIQKLLNCQIQMSNLSSQKTIISELMKLSEKLNELFLKNPDLEIYNLTKDLLPILITFTYNKNNNILIKSSEILSFLNEKIIKEIFNLSQKEQNELIDIITNNDKEIDLIDNEENYFKEGLNIIDIINQRNKSNFSENQHIANSKRGRPKKTNINSEISSDYFSSKLSEGIFNIKDNFNLDEKNVYDEFMSIISCKDKDIMENDFSELSNNFFNNIYDKNNNDLEPEMAKIRKKLCIKIFKMVHKLFPEIKADFLKKVIVYFEYKIRNDNTNFDKIYTNKIYSLIEIIKKTFDKTK